VRGLVIRSKLAVVGLVEKPANTTLQRTITNLNTTLLKYSARARYHAAPSIYAVLGQYLKSLNIIHILRQTDLQIGKSMSACALHNGFFKCETREAEYLKIINRYDEPDRHRFAELLGQVVKMLEPEPRDMLGPLYMELEIASKDRGQFFTPPELSEMMARLMIDDPLSKLETQPFITLHEPACGAGGMVLSVVKTLIDAGHNPADKLWVQCIDVDRLAALMCFVQLSLWHVPAEIIVGNTLTLETREVWHTPAHHLGFWSNKLRREQSSEADGEGAPLLREPPEQLSLF